MSPSHINENDSFEIWTYSIIWTFEFCENDILEIENENENENIIVERAYRENSIQHISKVIGVVSVIKKFSLEKGIESMHMYVCIVHSMDKHSNLYSFACYTRPDPQSNHLYYLIECLMGGFLPSSENS